MAASCPHVKPLASWAWNPLLVALAGHYIEEFVPVTLFGHKSHSAILDVPEEDIGVGDDSRWGNADALAGFFVEITGLNTVKSEELTAVLRFALAPACLLIPPLSWVITLLRSADTEVVVAVPVRAIWANFWNFLASLLFNIEIVPVLAVVNSDTSTQVGAPAFSFTALCWQAPAAADVLVPVCLQFTFGSCGCSKSSIVQNVNVCAVKGLACTSACVLVEGLSKSAFS